MGWRARWVRILVLLAAAATTVVAGGPAEPVHEDVNRRLREAAASSQVIGLARAITDRFPHRLTGTPMLEDAGRWAADRLRAWGLEQVRLEPWAFDAPGWTSDAIAVRLVAPVAVPVAAAAVAWTPGTPGPVKAPVVLIDPPAPATRDDLERWFAGRATSLRGRIVVVGTPAPLPPLPPLPTEAPRWRLAEEDLRKRYAPRPAGVAQPAMAAAPPSSPETLSVADRDAAISELLKRHGAVARVTGGRDRYGLLRAVANVVRDVGRHVPWIAIPREEHGRIARLIEVGAAVEMRMEVTNRLWPSGRTAYHVVADLPGTDRAGEVVLLGAHLDAHPLAQGATDNAAGVAVMMEAVRLLRAVEARPRRTVRLVLWSGEEQRVAGSLAWVRTHLGSAEDPGPAFGTLSAAFNLDNGSGRIRGMHVFGPPEAGEVLRQILAPFADLGVVGATTYRNRTPPGSDHAAFSVNGLPGVWVDQDPLDYGEASWHSSADTFERLVEDDLRQAAVVMAAAVYHVAMRDAPLPRFAPSEMPAPGSR